MGNNTSTLVRLSSNESGKFNHHIANNPSVRVFDDSYRINKQHAHQLAEIFTRQCPNCTETLKSILEEYGWAVVDLGNTFQINELRVDVTSATAINAIIGFPIQPYQRFNLWKALGVNLEVASGKATATDFIPLHIDLVNTTSPPAYSCLLTVRVDPLGGGNSLVGDFADAIANLSATDIEALKQKSFVDGRFLDIENVGEEYNPFPIISEHDDFIRFTAKWNTENCSGENHKARVNLNKQLLSNARRHLLVDGQMIILNQRRVAHGREDLGDGQADVPESKRRLILQSFISDNM